MPDESTWYTRRRMLVIGAAGGVTSLSGCLDILFGDDVEFAAEEASIPETTLDETGYELVGVESIEQEKTFAAAGEERTVRVHNRLHNYDKSLALTELGIEAEEVRAGTIGIVTTPQVSVLGQTFNPVEDMDPPELAELVQDQLEDIEDLDHVDTDTATVLGTDINVDRFAGRSTIADGAASVDIYLHIGEPVANADDFVIPIGGYPTAVDDAERDHVFTMMEAIEHG